MVTIWIGTRSSRLVCGKGQRVVIFSIVLLAVKVSNFAALFSRKATEPASAWRKEHYELLSELDSVRVEWPRNIHANDRTVA